MVCVDVRIRILIRLTLNNTLIGVFLHLVAGVPFYPGRELSVLSLPEDQRKTWLIQ